MSDVPTPAEYEAPEVEDLMGAVAFLASDERAEVVALRHRVLARLVLRPAVERHIAPARRIARLVRMDRGAAAVERGEMKFRRPLCGHPANEEMATVR